MQLPDNLRRQLAEEYRFAVEKMRAATDPAEILYFFSAFFGEAQRVLNLQWDADLALVHHVSQAAYPQISGRLQAARSGADPTVTFPSRYWDELTEAANQLARFFEHEEVDGEGLLQGILARIAELTYVTGGNGYYLYLRGKLKV